MYIEPNSTIKIYHNVPLDNTYNHTIYFDSLAQQRAYFNTFELLKYTLTNQTYQRVVKGKMRIEIKAENLYDCNYLSFQNTSFGNKIFYAFITGVEYVNNVTSEISFEIDVMQTYLFDVTLKECFVEREHSTTDIVGDNIISEPVDTGDITCTTEIRTNLFYDYVAVVCLAENKNDPLHLGKGGLIGGLPTGCGYFACDVNVEEEVNKFLSLLELLVGENRADEVVSIFIMPKQFYTTESSVVSKRLEIEKLNNIHGYVPRNKKLLTYPYNYLVVNCGNNANIYRYEWFKEVRLNKIAFLITGCMSCNPQIMIEPQDYNGAILNYSENLIMDGFPQIAWTIDSFKQWLSREASSSALKGLVSGLTMILGGATSNPTLVGVGAISMLNNGIDASFRPNQTRGSNGGSIDVASERKDFYFNYMQISEQYAKTIDDFFDMYGYATNRVKVPNRNFRAHWNYVKTKGCILIGNAPSDDVRKLCEIYDNGITFWKNGNEVGNYSLNNSI